MPEAGPMSWKSAAMILRTTVVRWNRDNTSLLAAGLSYFAVFSLVPIIILVLAISGRVLGGDVAERLLAARLQGLIGAETAFTLQALVAGARQSGAGTATVLSVLLLFFASSRIFHQLHAALNVIWGVPDAARKTGLLHQARRIVVKRLISFGMVILTGALMLLSFIIDALLAGMREELGDSIALLRDGAFWEGISLTVSFVLVMVVTALVYQFLPDTRVSWRDAWVGAAMTSLLLSAGRVIIGLYFRLFKVGSLYGFAGSFVLIVVGIYMSAQIFLFGAEFTRVYASRSRAASASSSSQRA
jgi:membrane protein